MVHISVLPEYPKWYLLSSSLAKASIFAKAKSDRTSEYITTGDITLFHIFRMKIDCKKCVTIKMEFLIVALLIREPDHFVTREQIAKTIWPKENEMVDTVLLNNRIDGHIKGLRKTLCEFPGYQLITIKGKGYRLFIPSSEPKKVSLLRESSNLTYLPN